LRLRPALDLLAQVHGVPEGPVIDLGCGDGAVGPSLAARWPGRVTGVDRSPAMLARAAAQGCYCALHDSDISAWVPQVAPALIFSNAALQWLPDHEALLPRLARMLRPAGTLAVQMPRQNGAPSHRFLRDIAASLYPDRFDFADYAPPVRPAVAYWELLSPLGHVEAWETEYVHRLDPATDAHPVRLFTESTAMRPFVERMTRAEAKTFLHAYDAALKSAYPLLPDGAALMPFRRMFLLLTV